MSGQQSRWRLWHVRDQVYLLTVALLAMVVTAVAAVQVGPGGLGGMTGWPSQTRPAFPASTRFYVDPENPAARWAREHPHDRRAAVIRNRIAAQPQAAWFTHPDPGMVRRQMRTVVHAARARAMVPVLVAYAIPQRDCEEKSTGGTGDLAAYRSWIDSFARGLGRGTAVVILEPDALALMGCLDPRQRSDRYKALRFAARTLDRHAPGARVYYDAGNSGWHPARTMAERLSRAGFTEYGDGIALNVSNFNATRDEVRYGLSVLQKAGSGEERGSRLGVVIDTSRNGAGPTRDRRFCDPPGRELGTPPTADTGIDRIDAYLWVKHPGQADGCIAEAGTFVPGYAYRLAD
ncbi:glycoside hydrolase family 6 protein [Streptomyces gobiensis]|uniref:glycoside hydrolase family 6 protein n=1 Tax=Streptomyces gobiensis TaxID=2875706 RepID=UPI001E5D403D|nr:glycoside hydrolase family 6 protein [Streptomyces gobiensis]UGY90951.1 glycoside hydrolase family 6 protein [Streptomyces gobiensis]